MALSYDDHKERMREDQRRKTKAGQDIGQPPSVEDPQRRAECWDSFRRFCECYFPERFTLAWSPDHLTVIARIEDAILHGGLFALAMPRGTGKTTLAECACIWAAITGRHGYVMPIAVNAGKVTDLLEAIKTELMVNNLLFADFPEVCHPIRALEDRANRAKGQHVEGRKTFIRWQKTTIILPTVYVDGVASVASGVIIRGAGLTSGGIRGSKFVRPDGKTVRPSLVLLDDPQDDESAASLIQCERRLRLANGALLGMAGPGKAITVICPCTVIRKGDFADSLLDRSKSPTWVGSKFKLLHRWPDRMDLWDDYSIKRADEFRNGGDGSATTRWYGQQKAEMDLGSVVAWPERFKPNELSAIQFAMNLFYDNAEAFWSEYQNEPLDQQQGAESLKIGELIQRLNGVPRRTVPIWATHLTAFVDVQQKVLYFMVCAWSDSFQGSVVDYGAWPDQSRRYFTLADVQKTLARAAPGAGLEGSIYAGLDKLAKELLPRDWHNEGGHAMRIDRMLVDANWGKSTNVVYEWCRATEFGSLVMPSHGRYIGASSRSFGEYQAKPGERLGTNWLVTAKAGKRAIRHVVSDVNWWKTFVAERLKTPMGDKGAMTLFGRDPQEHQMLAEHCTSEYFARVTRDGSGRTVDEWKWKAEKPDNHFWDCIVGNAVAASMEKVTLMGEGTAAKRAMKRVSYAELQREALAKK
jgi:hypothetical protein